MNNSVDFAAQQAYDAVANPFGGVPNTVFLQHGIANRASAEPVLRVTGAAVPPREEGSADCHSARARAIFALLYRKMKKDLEELLSAERFSPFVVTANDGFSIAVDSPKRCLVGARMLVVSDAEGNLFHFPFTGIAHISEPESKKP